MKNATKKTSEEEKKSFWATLPGILTGLAAVITAVAGLLAAVDRFAPRAPTPTAPPANPPTVSNPAPATFTPPPPDAISGTYGAPEDAPVVVTKVANGIYRIEALSSNPPYSGCAITWNGKIFGVVRFESSGEAAMIYMDVNQSLVPMRLVYLTDAHGNLVPLNPPPPIRIDPHAMALSGPSPDGIAGTYDAPDFIPVVVSSVADGIYRYDAFSGSWPLGGCAIAWKERIFGMARFVSGGEAVLVHMDLSGSPVSMKFVYLTDPQGNLNQLPQGVRIDPHALTK